MIRTTANLANSTALSAAQIGAVAFASTLLFGGVALAQPMPAPDMMMMPMPPTPPPNPSMAGPLSLNATPWTLDLGPVGGKVYVDGAVTGLGFWQDNATHIGSDSQSRLDLSNGEVWIQKADGIFQFYVQGGIYSLPALGLPYANSHQTTELTYGWVPVGFVKIAPADNFSVEVGKLPTLIGDEYTFTFQNMNIFRGLLWDQEPAVSRGVQVNYTMGPVALAVSLNDGYYSNRYNWISGSAAWTIDMANTISFVGGGNVGRTDYATSASPLLQNNGSIFNVIYTHSDGPIVISPYFQYSDVPAAPAIGIPHDASTTGVALLASFAFNDFLKLAGRVEYIDSTGKGATLAQSSNLLFGPGSNGFSFSITPTFQYQIFYARAEWSIVTAGSTVNGFAFGPAGRNTSQDRFAIEGGVLF